MKKTFAQLQAESGLSNQKAADYLGISKSSVKRYGNGTANPTRNNLIALSVLSSLSPTEQKKVLDGLLVATEKVSMMTK